MSDKGILPASSSQTWQFTPRDYTGNPNTLSTPATLAIYNAGTTTAATGASVTAQPAKVGATYAYSYTVTLPSGNGNYVAEFTAGQVTNGASLVGLTAAEFTVGLANSNVVDWNGTAAGSTVPLPNTLATLANQTILLALCSQRIVVSGTLTAGYADTYYYAGIPVHGYPYYTNNAQTYNLSSNSNNTRWLLTPYQTTTPGYQTAAFLYGALPSPSGLTFTPIDGSTTGTPIVLAQAVAAVDPSGSAAGTSAVAAAAGSSIPSLSQMVAGFQTVNNNFQLLRTATAECNVIVPANLYIPPSSFAVYWLDAYFQDDTNTPFNPDSNAVTVHASLMDGTSMDARLVNATYPTDPTTGVTALAKIADGHYRGYVLVESTDTEQPVSFSGSYSVTAPAWVTATNYVIGQIVSNSGSNYRCLVNHTSTVFATDLAANDWVVVSVTKYFGGVVDLASLTPQATLNTIESQTVLIGTNAADSPNAVTAQGNAASAASAASTAAGNTTNCGTPLQSADTRLPATVIAAKADIPAALTDYQQRGQPVTLSSTDETKLSNAAASSSTAASAAGANNTILTLLQRLAANRIVKTTSGYSITVYSDDGNTILGTMTWTDDNAGNESRGAFTPV